MEPSVPANKPPEFPRVNPVIWIGLTLLLLLVFALELALGSLTVPLGDVVDILLGGKNSPEGWRQIVLLFRLPRAITAMLAGAALSVAGLKMQTLFRNPLADPFVLGISSGASLGVAFIVLAAGSLNMGGLLARTGVMGNTALIVAATVGSMTVLSVVLSVARKVESALTLLIVGLMFGYITSSIVSVLMQFSSEYQTQNYMLWTFGSFAGVTWRQMTVFAPAISIGVLLAWPLAKPLNAMLLGEEYAHSMGVSVKIVRGLIIVSASLLSGAVTAFCGPVGFLGIAVPHLCRALFRTSDNHVLFPATVLLGAALAMFADLVAQVPGTGISLPLNAITALVGAPVVVSVILRRRSMLEAG
ncbi:MAG: iron ABC transporter permease [Acidobacteriota bacterium]|jgi:iron complex transport system permease protein|nr:iron ABC transporter permease [Acidobacteriota bacterium]